MTQNGIQTESNSNDDGSFVSDKVVKAERRISAYPWDTEAWSVLIRDAQTKKIDDARPVFERLITQFPNAGRYWKIYVEAEMKARNYEKVEKLFQRCLMKVLNIDLWKTYLAYIRETKGSLPSYREKMAQAYDFALDKIGMDTMSYTIWLDYINFLKSVEAVGSYAENQRITAVRKVFQRGINNPMINIELLWKDYCIFEQNVNPLIAKKMQEDKGRDYTNARRVAKELEQNTKGLNRNMPSVPPQNTPDEVNQVKLWKAYISWEKSNPLRTEDHAAITKRVMFSYEQCLLCLGFHPDIWIEAAAYLEMSSRLLTEKGDQNAGKLFADEAAAMYERAISAMLKNNMLIYFAYADFEETRMKYDKVHVIYKRLMAITDVDPTLAYIQYMKFARRAEGIKSARSVFKLAREDTRCKHHAYVAAALMEYYCSKDKGIAHKIFELGLKKFGEHAEYVIEAIKFMDNLNEDNNTRVLFERVLTSGQILPEKSHEIWCKFLEFESNVGDLASIMKVEKRRAQALGEDFEDKETALLIDRYRYLDLFPCSNLELHSLGYREIFCLNKQNILSNDVLCDKKIIIRRKDNMESGKPKYPMPDPAQMVPFKPKIFHSAGAHPTDGGIFPCPPTASDLMTKLPPPTNFHGPFVSIDKFMEHFRNLKLPDEAPHCENGFDPSNIDTGTALSIDYAMGRKRRISENHDDSDDEQSAAPPINDIYRARQQKKAR